MSFDYSSWNEGPARVSERFILLHETKKEDFYLQIIAGTCKCLYRNYSALHICRHLTFHNPEHNATQCKNNVVNIDSVRYLYPTFLKEESALEDLCVLAGGPLTEA